MQPLHHAQRLANRLGPGLITGAADDDPSGLATYSQAGAELGAGLGIGGEAAGIVVGGAGDEAGAEARGEALGVMERAHADGVLPDGTGDPGCAWAAKSLH